ncbi:MAG: cytochrome c peroxidase [Gammaproteobacteria bacterium]|nr:cytochrome c peroxidase [Gammaproteobacteria bacterium]
MTIRAILLLTFFSLGFGCWWQASAQLSPVPVPVENPITETKRVLGKILFWDEQLSSNDTVACGTCHQPAFGGGDSRYGRYTGSDKGTIDDIWGSPGVVHMDESGDPVSHTMFGFEPQVTPRMTPSNFGALWATEQFWDGRATSEFLDPLTGEIVIPSGGSLENQAISPLFNPVEMARPGRTWEDIISKLESVDPLALASDIPRDMLEAIQSNRDYPSLFQAAFGDKNITPVRIVFAIATYQRTLVPDQTPWDHYMAGNENALSEDAKFGWRVFQELRCVNCHEPPLFTNNDYLNIGLRLAKYDLGRQAITGIEEDGGEVKVPSLRNVGLKARFMHTGEFSRLSEAIVFYDNGIALPGRDDIPNGGAYNFNITGYVPYDLEAFLRNGLTDPRVKNETFPFDRPKLNSEKDSLLPE